MNSQDLHNLQEAYIGVYELDEDGWQPPTQKKADKMMKQASKLHRTASETGEPGNPEAEKKHTQASKIYFMSRRMSDKATARDKEAARKEFVNEDLYDIILSHLLDEGYADTQEQAEVIMVNMSEDWRESIVEEVLEEEKKSLPVSRMAKQARRIAFSYGTDVNSDEGSSGNVPHSNPKKALAKMARIGGKKVKQHIKKGYEQGSQYDPYNQELNWRNPSRNAGY